MTRDEYQAKYGAPPPVSTTPAPVQTPTANTPIRMTHDEYMAKYGNQPNVNADKATFQASGDESPLGAIAKTVGNIPSSLLNFGKSTLDFLNPLNTLKTAQNIGTTAATALNEGQSGSKLVSDTITGIPQAAYDVVVPQFLKHIFSGDLKSAAATIENDPIGQIAPLILVARGAAEKIGRGAEFDNAMSSLAKPVTTPIVKATNALGTGIAQTLGASTGAGASSIKETFSSALNPASLEAQTQAMRGQIQPDTVVSSAQDIFQKIKDERSSAYVEKLKQIGEDTKAHDISPITTELPNQLQKFGIKETSSGLDFSRSSIANNSTARADIQGVYDTVKSWGSQAGDRTGVGLDLLKKQLDDFYSPTSQGRAFVQALKSKVVGLLNTEVPGYRDMTSQYAKYSNFIEDIKSATGVGGKAKADTVFTKLTTAMKGDKEFRLEVMKQMEQTDPTLMDKIAGINLNSWIPRGLVGKGIDIGTVMSTLLGHFNPKVIPLLLSTSPRLVGEFVRAAGIISSKVSPILKVINNLNAHLPVGTPERQSFVDKISSLIKETPNKQGGFVVNPLSQSESASKSTQVPKVTTINSSIPISKGIPQSVSKVNNAINDHIAGSIDQLIHEANQIRNGKVNLDRIQELEELRTAVGNRNLSKAEQRVYNEAAAALGRQDLVYNHL